jgi:glycosyltransferase involved in cell wall biosynthesis
VQSIFLREVEGRIDMSRVHFTGRLPYPDYLNMLRVSSAHVYLSYPFVLSWSLIEAMSVGCAIVASDTPPVRGDRRQQGILVPFFDVEQWAERRSARRMSRGRSSEVSTTACCSLGSVTHPDRG